jgi:hypothetical protein
MTTTLYFLPRSLLVKIGICDVLASAVPSGRRTFSRHSFSSLSWTSPSMAAAILVSTCSVQVRMRDQTVEAESLAVVDARIAIQEVFEVVIWVVDAADLV